MHSHEGGDKQMGHFNLGSNKNEWPLLHIQWERGTRKDFYYFRTPCIG